MIGKSLIGRGVLLSRERGRARCAWPVVLCCFAAFSLATARLSADPNSSATGGQVHTFALRKAKASEVEPGLKRILDEMRPQPKIEIDELANRITVRGTPSAITAAQRVIDVLDPRLAPKPAATPATLRKYPTHGRDVAQLVAQLQQRFAAREDVKIAHDRRSGQVLVVGPEDVHKVVKATLPSPPPRPKATIVERPVAKAQQPPSTNTPVRRYEAPPARTPAAQPVPVQPAPVQPAPVQPAPAQRASGTATSPTRTTTSKPPARYPESVSTQPARKPAAAKSWTGEMTSRTLSLNNLDAETARGQLQRILNNPLPLLPDAQRRIAFRLEAASGSAVDVVIDPVTRLATVTGRAALVESWIRVLESLDASQGTDRQARVVALGRARPAQVQQVAVALGGETSIFDGNRAVASRETNRLVSMLFQSQKPPADQPENQAPEAKQPAEKPPLDTPLGPALPNADDGGGLIGQVQVEFLDGLDVMVIRGHPRDVERVIAIINQIEQLSAVTEPRIEVLQLQHVGSRQLADLIAQLYDQALLARIGNVSITPLIKPNALLLIGRNDSIATLVGLVQRLDQPVDAASQFAVFRLKNAGADQAKVTIDQFYTERPGLGARVLTTADFRSNSLIVQASPRDLAEVGLLVQKLDVPKSEAVNELKVFQLENSLADELAPILQEAIQGQLGQGGRRTPGIGAAGLPSQPAAGTAGSAQSRLQQARSTVLRFLTIGPQGTQQLESGILLDVRITADPRANALIVSAPAESMGLVGALIRELDQLPAAEAQLKVFTIANGDAASLVEMLEALFGQAQATRGQQLAPTGPGAQDNLVSLRFSVDPRTNSIIASGTAGDLAVIEAVLLRLDESDVRQRKSVVYRLKNAPAIDVATAVNEMLRSERQVQQTTAGLLSPFEQIEREVVVVPEPVSNSLIVSATPRYFEEIRALVEQLDERPPMVTIQVLIAEVSLSDTDEFGVELGLQDTLLFNRSLLSDIVTTTETTTVTQPGGAVTSFQNQVIQAATVQPGFNFNNQPLGNSGSDLSLGTAEYLASQGLTSFGVGRVNSELGFGGFVFSAASENISMLIRALQETRRLDVLARPQIMTLDNQPAFVQVGQRVPRITGVQINETGQVNTVQLENVGIILGVTPRISPDGLVVMEIDAEKSELGPEAEGIPISINVTGDVIRSPRINTTTAQTTVSALSGQTVVLGGLITKSSATTQRRVPFVADVPILGNLFRYDSIVGRRTELLIIMTPHIIRNEEDAEVLKQVESARMSWVLSDVVDMHGPSGLRGRNDEWADSETHVVYPESYDHDNEELTPPPANPGVSTEPNQPPTPSGSATRPTPQTPPKPPTAPPQQGLPAPQNLPQSRAQPPSMVDGVRLQPVPPPMAPPLMKSFKQSNSQNQPETNRASQADYRSYDPASRRVVEPTRHQSQNKPLKRAYRRLISPLPSVDP